MNETYYEEYNASLLLLVVTIVAALMSLFFFIDSALDLQLGLPWYIFSFGASIAVSVWLIVLIDESVRDLAGDKKRAKYYILRDLIQYFKETKQNNIEETLYQFSKSGKEAFRASPLIGNERVILLSHIELLIKYLRTYHLHKRWAQLRIQALMDIHEYFRTI